MKEKIEAVKLIYETKLSQIDLMLKSGNNITLGTETRLLHERQCYIEFIQELSNILYYESTSSSEDK